MIRGCNLLVREQCDPRRASAGKSTKKLSVLAPGMPLGWVDHAPGWCATYHGIVHYMVRYMVHGVMHYMLHDAVHYTVHCMVHYIDRAPALTPLEARVRAGLAAARGVGDSAQRELAAAVLELLNSKQTVGHFAKGKP